MTATEQPMTPERLAEIEARQKQALGSLEVLAHAREDIPALLREVARQREELKIAADQYGYRPDHGPSAAEGQIRSLEEQVARLKGEVERLSKENEGLFAAAQSLDDSLNALNEEPR